MFQFLAALNNIAVTGDENPILVWIILACVALVVMIAAIVLVLINRKKGAKKPVRAENAPTDPATQDPEKR